MEKKMVLRRCFLSPKKTNDFQQDVLWKFVVEYYEKKKKKADSLLPRK
jgi:hypothetical protein